MIAGQGYRRLFRRDRRSFAGRCTAPGLHAGQYHHRSHARRSRPAAHGRRRDGDDRKILPALRRRRLRPAARSRRISPAEDDARQPAGVPAGPARAGPRSPRCGPAAGPCAPCHGDARPALATQQAWPDPQTLPARLIRAQKPKSHSQCPLHSASIPASTPLDRAAWFATIAGLCASLVAIGLARFAYTPLIPPLIEAHWFSSADVVALGAANFAGYLAGAFAGPAHGRSIDQPQCVAADDADRDAGVFRLRLSAVGDLVLRLAVPVGPIRRRDHGAWWQTTILPHIPLAKRGFVGGMIFLGLGLGIAASGTLIPELLAIRALGNLDGAGHPVAGADGDQSGLAGRGQSACARPPSADQHTAPPQNRFALRMLYGQYAVLALGLVPGMVFLVDYIARGLGRGCRNRRSLLGAVWPGGDRRSRALRLCGRQDRLSPGLSDCPVPLVIAGGILGLFRQPDRYRHRHGDSGH